MAEYIERQAAIDTVAFGITIASAFNKDTGVRIDLFANENAELTKAINRIRDLPSADVVHVVHGKWIREWWHSGGVRKCSTCNITQTVNVYNGEVKFNYCPYCGAKMDEKGEE